MNVKMILTPGILFAAGTMAGTAHGATVIDTNYAPTSGDGTQITLLGGAFGNTAQFSFYDRSEPLVGTTAKYQIVANSIDQNAAIYYQGVSTAIPGSSTFSADQTSVYTSNDSGKELAHGDGNYALRFSAGASTYTGFAAVANNGSLIDSVTYEAVSGLPAVPEPATWMMMILGMGAAGAALRRRNRQVALAA